MPQRTSMDNLILRVRRDLPAVCNTATSSPPSSSAYLTDQQIQDVLDSHRFTVRYAPLRPAPTLTQGALYNYTDYYADVGNWEEDEVLTWVNFATVTPATADRISGHWTFALPAPGQYPPVYITGKYYDVEYTLHDLLRQVIANLSLTTYDFTADGATFRRGTIITTLQELAKSHLRRAMATSHPARRSDVQGNFVPWSLASGGPGDIGSGDDS